MSCALAAATATVLPVAARGEASIYAGFVCQPARSAYMNPCQMAIPSPMGGRFFQTLSDCQNFIRNLGRALGDGRYGSNDFWYECRGKRIETWDRTE
jgi:hypothetical protein